MPELAEIKLTSDYINSKTKDLIFDKVRKNPEHKGSSFSLRRFKILSESRGKELKIILDCGESKHNLMMTMGMGGYFRLTETGNEIKHSHLMFDSTNGYTLSFVDVRRFGRWKFGEWNKDRSPDPVFEFDAFKKNILSNVNLGFFENSIMDSIMDQRYFNGIGNYLRAEILYKGDINPFQSLKSLIDSDKRDVFFGLCKSIPYEAYLLGGGNLYTWETPESFVNQLHSGERWEDWMVCYGNKSMCTTMDKNGRRLWYNPKWKSYDKKK